MMSHLGRATQESLFQGGGIGTAEIVRFSVGEPLVDVAGCGARWVVVGKG